MKTESTRNTHYTKILNDVQLILGCLLALASTGAMVMTLQSFVNDWLSKTFAVLASFALQGCLYLFANNENHRIKFFSWVLLAFSVIATTLFMENTWQQQRQNQTIQQSQRAEQSWTAEQLRTQITELNREINISTTSAEVDINTSYRKRGNETMSSMGEKKKERDSLIEQLRELTTTSNIDNSESVLEENPPLRFALFTMIALVIDISAILAFGTLAESGNRETSWHDPKPQQPEYRQKQLPFPAEPDIQQQEDKTDHLGTILAKIREGEYGEFVPVKQIVENEPVRHPELKAGIDQLMEEGVLVRSGNRYRHTAFEKQPELCMS